MAARKKTGNSDSEAAKPAAASAPAKNTQTPDVPASTDTASAAGAQASASDATPPASEEPEQTDAKPDEAVYIARRANRLRVPYGRRKFAEFDKGRFTTSDPTVIRELEKNGEFGRAFYRDGAE